MTFKFTHEIGLEFPCGPEGGEDAFEIQVRLDCIFHKGIPEQGPTYSSGGEPEEPAFVDAFPIQFRHGDDKWQAFSMLDEDAVIHAAAEEWIADNHDVLLTEGAESYRDRNAP